MKKQTALEEIDAKKAAAEAELEEARKRAWRTLEGHPIYPDGQVWRYDDGTIVPPEVAATRRGARKRRPETEWFHLRVAAASVSVGRLGPKILYPEPEGESRTYITIEGMLDRPALRDVLVATVQVSDGEEQPGNPGAAIGGSTVWQVACALPRAQFADLLALVLAVKVAKVDMLFEKLRRGSGVMRSIHFSTAPVPREVENGEEDGAPRCGPGAYPLAQRRPY